MSDASRKGLNATAGLSGAGSGTLLLALARNLSDQHWYKSWAVLIAPSVSVTITAGLTWCNHRREERLKREEIRARLDEAMQAAQDVIDDPHASEQEKQRARENQTAIRTSGSYRN